jgi:hypothetical protein
MVSGAAGVQTFKLRRRVGRTVGLVPNRKIYNYIIFGFNQSGIPFLAPD